MMKNEIIVKGHNKTLLTPLYYTPETHTLTPLKSKNLSFPPFVFVKVSEWFANLFLKIAEIFTFTHPGFPTLCWHRALLNKMPK